MTYVRKNGHDRAINGDRYIMYNHIYRSPFIVYLIIIVVSTSITQTEEDLV